MSLVPAYSLCEWLFVGGGSSFGSGYSGSYGGGAMKSTGYGQRGTGPYGGVSSCV